MFAASDSSSSFLTSLVLVLLLGVLLSIVTLAYVRTRRLVKELEQANRAKLEFLTTMSHELRTPLNAIAGYVDLLSLGLRGPVTLDQKEDLARIQRNQRQLLALINDVLNFAKLDMGSVLYAITDVQIVATLNAAFVFIEPQLKDKKIKYISSTISKSVFVRADEEKLYQIFVNLLSNAVKFTPPNGQVMITCQQDAQSVSIMVADTGIGIPVNKLHEIFDPFIQVDTSLTREHSGVGLGLSISRHLATGMGGDIVVDSQIGKGSTFTVTLPIASH